MWSAPTTDLVAYVDRRAVHLRSVSGYWPRLRVREAGQTPREHLQEHLREIRKEAKSARCGLHVLLASSVCRFLLLENTGRLRSDAEVLAAAAGPLRERLGLDPAEWIASLDREWDRTAMVCAMRAGHLEELRAAATATGTRLVSVRPWIGELLRAQNGLAKSIAALGVIEPDSVSLVLDRDGSTSVQTLLLNEGNDPLAALRYLAQGAGTAAETLSIVQFDPVSSAASTEAARRDFTDRAILRANPS